MCTVDGAKAINCFILLSQRGRQKLRAGHATLVDGFDEDLTHQPHIGRWVG